ncbi:MAG: hypothetical protein QOH35_5614 [Acidobacteriaceae bacterium]|jgi:hypothetical protein|nr:hypothetical protein [Acidobacteriaceae bacterium]MEA2544248.1 hypothetical protein [Acidobacteriaceae bacterium]
MSGHAIPTHQLAPLAATLIAAATTAAVSLRVAPTVTASMFEAGFAF